MPYNLFSPGHLTALIAIADTIRTEAPVAISSLKALGITPVMLTGDNYRTARAIAGQVGVGSVGVHVGRIVLDSIHACE